MRGASVARTSNRSRSRSRASSVSTLPSISEDRTLDTRDAELEDLAKRLGKLTARLAAINDEVERIRSMMYWLVVGPNMPHHVASVGAVLTGKDAGGCGWEVDGDEHEDMARARDESGEDSHDGNKSFFE